MNKIKEIVVVKNLSHGTSYEDVSIDKYEGMCEEKALSHSYVMNTLKKLMGRTLTLIDASIVDKTQNKSVKDIIRGIYSDEMNFLSDITYNQEMMNEMASEHFEGMSDEDMLEDSVTIEEALGVK
jgi:hypothetical protein